MFFSSPFNFLEVDKMHEIKNIDWNELWKHARDNSSYAKIRELTGLDAIEGWNKAAKRFMFVKRSEKKLCKK